MNFQIREAQFHEASALTELENRCFDGDQLGLRSFQRLIKQPSAHVYVIEAEASRALAGYALVLTRKNSYWQRLYSIAIAPEFRGQGIGKKLFSHIFEVAQHARCKGIRLEVKQANHAAIELYRAFGFEIVDLLPMYYEDGSDGYRMQHSFSSRAH
ncbi:MAG: putative acetyltransferase [Idiomarinaceae bacterium HL-53]|nr:MAG: putative acetyltransferase [Idiomarinaceae bacterium HL-53]CUS48315.1 Ribosomal protein S18 acetylase RimI [Idiomarinaceae bacterium HL-53]